MTKARQRQLQLKEPEDIALEQIANNIEKAANFGEAIKNSALKAETIVILLHEATRVSKKDIRLILKALPELKKEYLK